MPTPLLSSDAVLPKLPAETAVPPASDAKSDVPATLPDEVLQLPVVYGLLHGSPAAIYADMTVTDPDLELLGQNAPALAGSGIGFYASLDKKLGVLFNTAYVDETQLAEADAAGKLTEVAAPYEQVKQQFNEAAGGGPGAQAALGSPAAPLPSSTATGNPPSTKTQQKLATARVKNLQVGSPTSGPQPGAGRIINNILRTTI